MKLFRKFATMFVCWLLAVFVICLAAVLVGVFVQQLPYSAYGVAIACVFIWGAVKIYRRNNNG